MKIKIGRLKSIIREVASTSSVEVTEDPEAAAAAWPETTYRGLKVLDSVYPLVGELEKRITKNGDDAQEVYLGYVPGSDTFVAGWDVWRYSRNEYGEQEGRPDFVGAYQAFIVSEKADDIGATSPLHTAGHGFYGRGPEGTCLDVVHKKFPGIVDLRLD